VRLCRAARWRAASPRRRRVVIRGCCAVSIFTSFGAAVGIIPSGSVSASSPAAEATTDDERVYDVAVIGGGVVGLAVARELAVRGKKVVLLEREDAPAAGASSGNSGIGCTGYDAPLGSLERRLLRRAIQLHPALYRSFGMSYEHVRKCGSLVVAWSPEQLAELPKIVAQNRAAGDTEVVQLTQSELRRLEPALSTAALGAVWCPREAVVEPWLVPAGYARSARLNGAELRMSTEVVSVRRSAACHNNAAAATVAAGEQVDCGGVWRLQTTRRRATDLAPLGRSPPRRLRNGGGGGGGGGGADGDHVLLEELLVPPPQTSRQTPPVTQPITDSVRALAVVNCAGLFGDCVEHMRRVGEGGDSTGNSRGVGFTVTPRKGQFLVFGRTGSGGTVKSPSHIIEPVPTEFTKGVIVFTTVYGNVVVGPTAVDQHDKMDRSTDIATVQQLREWGERVVRSQLPPASSRRPNVV
jgi:L-2-hydroxyglutarate oxidase LhgO